MSSASQSSSSSGLSPAAAPYLGDYGQLIQNFAQRPFQAYQGPMVAGLSPQEQQALGGYSAIAPSVAGIYGNAGNAISTTMNGGMNPYIQDAISPAVKPVLETYNAATAGTRANFNNAGGVGSARQGLAQDLNDRNLAQGLGDAVGGLFTNQYNNMVGQRLQAAGLAPALSSGASSFLNNELQAGDIPRQNLQQVYDAARGQWTSAYDYPLTQLQGVAGAIAPLFGALPTTTTKTGSPPDPVQQGLGVLALGNMMNGSSSKASS